MKSSTSSPFDSVIGSIPAPAESARKGRSVPVLAVIMLVRQLMLILFLGLLAWVLPSDSIAFYALMALAFIVTVPYSLWLRDRLKLDRIAQLQFAVDLFIVTGLVYFTGGVESNLTLLYPLVILSAGLVNPPRRAIEIMVLCMVIYMTFCLLSYNGILLPYRHTDRLSGDWFSFVESAGLRILTFGLFGWAGVYVARRCGYLDRKASQYRQLAALVLRNLPVGLVLLDEKRRVVMVNKAATKLLHTEEASLIGKPFEIEKTEGGDVGEQRWLLYRPDGSSFAVHADTATVSVPPEVLGSETDEPQRLQALSFMDVSVHVAAEQQMREMLRLQTAARMASKVAHEVFNPVAAISGAAQVLRLNEERANAKGHMALSAEDVRTLHKQIIDESDKLNQTISQFLTAAEFNTEEYRRVMDMIESASDRISGHTGLNPADSAHLKKPSA